MTQFLSRSLAAACLAALVALAGCQSEKGQAPPPPPTVTVSQPEQKTVTVYADYTGSTEAFESVEIRARVEGFLDSIHFIPSGLVKKGDLLFVIEPKPYQALLDQALAELAIRKAELKLAEATLIRKENAFKDRAVSEVEVIQARAEKTKAEAAIKAAEAAVATARINLGYTRITSPISGRVGRPLVDAGNLIGRGEATLLTTVVNDDPAYAYFNIPERDLLNFLERKRAGDIPGNKRDRGLVLMGLANEKGFPHRGHLDYLDNKVDPKTGTIQVRARFPNPDHVIMAGLFVRIHLPVDLIENALLVPEAALSADQGGRYLLVVNDKDQVEYRRVKLGPQEGEMRVVLKGVKPGERVIVKGLQRVRPGIKVRAMTMEEAKAQEAAAKAKQAQKAQPADKDK